MDDTRCIVNRETEEEQFPSAVTPVYKTHICRWFVLATFSVLAFSNGLNWLTYSSIVKFSADYYNVSIAELNYLTIIFFVGSIVGSPFAMFVLDSLSLREAVWIGAILNFIGTVIRIVSAYLPSSVPYLGYGFAVLAQFIISLAQSYFLYAPPKVASVWFSDGERVVANTIISLGNVVGIAVSMLLAPSIVTSTDRLPILLGITAVPALIGLVMAAFNFRKRPLYPPSHSSEDGMKPWPGLKRLLRNWQYWFLCVIWALAAGVFNVFLALMPQFVCPFGYTEWYSGIVGAAMIFAGLIGSLIIGFIVDRTKRFEEISKLCMCITTLSSILVMEVFRIPNQHVIIAVSFILFGFFALTLIPVFSELAIEITYPVAEGTCNGILWTAVQFVAAGVTFIAPYFGHTPDLKYRNIIISGCYALLFWPKYKRIEAEKKSKADKLNAFDGSVN
ncbi:Major facilitator superfamily domain-containing protein 7-a-like [Oopsacas minuta]|uniref:Major facilitator superfamily domain-containing protein 7-a-like n=1 Tax=Oopsacas minuta TaxID=111878 RepID=A0AAV7JD47_9METZ|nr:Major facilitator superfamily domain-containing protein 7-a-like [Oopsacas minuta]